MLRSHDEVRSVRTRRFLPAGLLLATLLLLGSSCLLLCASAADPSPATPAPAGDAAPVSTPLSSALSSDSALPSSDITRRASLAVEDVLFGTDAVGLKKEQQRARQCPLDATLVWSASMGTGVYATGSLAHLSPDGREGGKHVLLPGFHRELSILDRDGHHVPGSPVHTGSDVYFHASPLLFDFNADGVQDILWVNVDGGIYVINGDLTSEQVMLDGPWSIPKIKLAKGWFQNLDTNNREGQQGQGGGARRLMSVEEGGAEVDEAARDDAMDPQHPLSIMRREKSTTYTLQRVERKLRDMARRERSSHAARGRTGRKLLQEETDAGTPPPPAADIPARVPRRNKWRRGTGVATPAPAATVATDAEGATPAAAVPAAKDAGEDSADDADDEADDSDAESDSPNVDEPAPLNAALGIRLREFSRSPPPMGANVDGLHLSDDGDGPPQLDRRAGIPRDYGASLKLPPLPTTDGSVDDQEDAPADGNDGWGAGGDEDPDSDAATISSSTPAALQAALDELLREAPDFGATISKLARANQQNNADTASDPDNADEARRDYARVIRELADKHSRTQAEVARRQAAHQQRAAPESEDEDYALPPVKPTGIASVDAANEAARQRGGRPADIATNVDRILATDDDDGDDTSAARSGAAMLDPQLVDDLPDEAHASFNLFADVGSGLGKGGSARLSELDPELAWELAELDRLYPVLPDAVWVDAHVLATPVLADLDGDNLPELIIPVSYFFDAADYAAKPALRKRLGAELDLKNYVAGALLVLDPRTRAILWHEHLDLSTDRTALRAHLYASPTVVDLEGDGSLEILVPTGMGFLYAFRASSHELLPGYPLTLGELQAPVTVEDVDGDGQVEMIAVDHRGRVSCFAPNGTEKWHTLISGASMGGATFGDVDGDGNIDVVIGTLSGHVWALQGKDGATLKHFPLRTDGRIVPPITLVPLWPEPSASDLLLAPLTTSNKLKGLHLLFPSFDGHVYVVEGRSGCVQKLDIGEHAYGQVLVDDVLGRGKLDIVVATMSGNVFTFATEAAAGPTHPLRAWPSLAQGLNGYSAREGLHGLYLTPACRLSLQNVVGTEVHVEYVIVDERATARRNNPLWLLRKMEAMTRETASKHANAGHGGAGAGDKDKDKEQEQDYLNPAQHAHGRIGVGGGTRSGPRLRYELTFSFGGALHSTRVHTRPGTYSTVLAAGGVPLRTRLEVRMSNEHGQVHSDDAPAAINVHGYKLIKYVVVLPFLGMCTLLLLMRTPHARS